MPNTFDVTKAFDIGRVSIGLGNADHDNRPAFAEAEVTIGAFVIRAFMNDSGEVSLPRSLRDERLRQQIAIDLRDQALAEFGLRLKARTEREAGRLAGRGAA